MTTRLHGSRTPEPGQWGWGHVFQGRFKSVLIQDEAALGAVARDVHLKPVRIGGLGLSKEDQRRAKVVGCPEPGAALVAPAVGGAESILGRKWAEMADRYGDWGRDGTLAVATRPLGWRLVEVVRQVQGVNDAAAAQGIRRFWRQAAQRAEMSDFTLRLRQKCQESMFDPIAFFGSSLVFPKPSQFGNNTGLRFFEVKQQAALFLSLLSD